MIFSKLFSKENKILMEKSLLNCHCQGLHSFVLSEENGLLTRMFITDDDHILWHNGCGQTYKGYMPLSIAVHPHHVDIELIPIHGLIWNAVFSVKKVRGVRHNQVPMTKYKWESHILNGKGGFKKIGTTTMLLDSFNLIQPGQTKKMKSNELHTVYVSKGQNAAWIVKEFVPTKKYNAINYSNADLTEWTSEGLYQKPTWEQIVEKLSLVKIFPND